LSTSTSLVKSVPCANARDRFMSMLSAIDPGMTPAEPLMKVRRSIPAPLSALDERLCGRQHACHVLGALQRRREQLAPDQAGDDGGVAGFDPGDGGRSPEDRRALDGGDLAVI